MCDCLSYGQSSVCVVLIMHCVPLVEYSTVSYLKFHIHFVLCSPLQSCLLFRKAAEPWRSPEFADCYPSLIRCQEVAWMSQTCLSVRIITKETNDALRKEKLTTTAMTKLLRMVCQFSENFPCFREVLRSHENNAYAGILERLDVIRPDPEGEVLVKQSLKLRVKFYFSYLSVWLALPMA